MKLDVLSRPEYVAFHNLTSFKVKICAAKTDVFDDAKLVQLLPYLLSRMCQLKKLDVNIESNMSDGDPQIPTGMRASQSNVSSLLHSQRANLKVKVCNYQNVFPIHETWPELIKFTLIGASIEAMDLIFLLRGRMSQLRHLTLN